MITFKKLSEILDGELLQLVNNYEIKYLITDSRTSIPSTSALFFARQGPNYDGHDFINEAYYAGIRNFLVEKQVDHKNFPGANFYLYPSSLKALQQIAHYKRLKFENDVIGITGSNGKTIVKEWLLQLLSSKFRIAATPYSYNSQLGVPLSVWNLSENHDLGIFEAGISRKGEMLNLQEVIKPTIGIFTNIGSAHAEGFDGIEQKIREKLLLFQSTDQLIYCKDHHLIDQAISTKSDQQVLTWGTNEDSDLQITEVVSKGDQSIFKLRFKEQEKQLTFPVTDPASQENLMHCVATMVLLNYAWDELQERLHLIKPIAMRLELKKGINGCFVLDDSYSNDLAGLTIALDYMAQNKQRQKKTVILSDIFQSGLPGHELYSQVNMLLIRHQVDRIIGIGPKISDNEGSFDMAKEFFSTTEEFVENIDNLTFANEMILIKGARSFRFETISNRLQEKYHGTRLEINLGAIIHNLNFYRSKISRNTKIMVMVKAFAYGTGMLEIANLLQYQKVDHLGVAYTDEGVNLRNNGIQIPIMIMNPSPDGYEKLFQYNLEPEVYDFKILKELIKISDKRKIKIHLKVDTGMKRLGFEEHQLDEVIDQLKQNPHFEVESIFSHLAAADDLKEESFTHRQVENYNNCLQKITEKMGISPIRHILNSAGIIKYP